ncbi:MAG TPA: amidohydrolase family protein [Mycobacteriales bacterium]|nr:amidohydrolase family protein [Mycobacteriales bacterium]
MTLVRHAEVDRKIVDVRFDGRVVRQVSPHPLTPLDDEEVIDGGRCALLPGLHDHHIHLLATARAATSIDVSSGVDALAAAPATGGWLRAVGGTDDLDAAALDRVVTNRPVRVQHHSGAMWVLNSAGLAAVGSAEAAEDGIERDASGSPTGRLWRLDDWLGSRVDDDPPDLGPLGRRLSDHGITGVTDATPHLGAGAELIAAATLPQRIHFLAADAPAWGVTGPRKIVLEDHDLPSYTELRETIADARVLGRAVAVHCVTRESLLLLLAVLDEIGAVTGDRIEHASIADATTVERIARLGVAVVTQPGFICQRGDRYLADVPADDLPDLYRYSSLVEAKACVVPSSDAPYGPLDPWTIMRAARDRRSESGARVNVKEWVAAAMVLDGYLRHPDALHAPRRRITPGAPSDLILLQLPLAEALDDPRAELVRRTWHARHR